MPDPSHSSALPEIREMPQSTAPVSDPGSAPLVQRTDPQGVRLVRTGMPDRIVLADIADAIQRHGLTIAELRAVLDDHTSRASVSDLPSVPAPSIQVVVDPSVPPDQVQMRDAEGRILGRITDVAPADGYGIRPCRGHWHVTHCGEDLDACYMTREEALDAADLLNREGAFAPSNPGGNDV